jgi:hypothetical protein
MASTGTVARRLVWVAVSMGAAAVSASSWTEDAFDLGGDGWTVASSNGTVVAQAVVPGVVHTDLLRAGLIPEPYADFNELALRWVALDNWTYTRNFTSSPQMLNGINTLQFDGTVSPGPRAFPTPSCDERSMAPTLLPFLLVGQ